MQLALLGAFFMRGEPFGKLNDAAIVIQYALALPLVLALHGLLRSQSQRLSIAALLLGVIGIAAIAILQVLLIVRVLSFAQEVLPVCAALFLIFGGWLLITGHLARSLPNLPRSMVMCFVGWTYLGYPIWAFWLARRLVATSPTVDR